MKHKHLIPLSLLVAVIPFVSCSDDDENELTVPGNEQKDPSDVIPNDTTSNPSDTLVSNHPYVDLGLPSGTLWATYNVGATKPEEAGGYYAWGETETKEVYNWGTYKWVDARYSDIKREWIISSVTKYNYNPKTPGPRDSLTSLLPEDDAATANWGNEWRMPTIEEQKEIIDNCYMVWTDNFNGTDVHGTICYKAKSSSDKGHYVRRGETPSADYNNSDVHIFIPAVGHFIEKSIENEEDSRDHTDIHGEYWSSTLYTIDEFYQTQSMNGSQFSIWKNSAYATSTWRFFGYPIRAVRAK